MMIAFYVRVKFEVVWVDFRCFCHRESGQLILHLVLIFGSC